MRYKHIRTRNHGRAGNEITNVQETKYVKFRRTQCWFYFATLLSR